MAGIGSGIGATIISQAADTIKTIQQVAAQTAPVSLGTAAKRLAQAQGIHGFFKGGLPRGTRVVAAVTIIGGVKEKMEDVLREPSSKKIPQLS